MDFLTLLTDNLVIVVVLACLIVGYIIKTATFLKWVNNADIPVILAVFGAVVNVIASGLSLDAIVFGAFMGLASTGLHQAFKRFIENSASE